MTYSGNNDVGREYASLRILAEIKGASVEREGRTWWVVRQDGQRDEVCAVKGFWLKGCESS